MPTVTYNVSDFASLNSAIASADDASLASGGSGTNYVINIASGTINLSSMYAINLAGSASITINGNGATLDGGAGHKTAYSGTAVHHRCRPLSKQISQALRHAVDGIAVE